MIQQHLDYISGFDTVIGGNRFSVNPYVACIRSRLDTVAAGIGHVLCEIFVYPFFSLTLIYLAPPSLPQLFVFYIRI